MLRNTEMILEWLVVIVSHFVSEQKGA